MRSEWGHGHLSCKWTTTNPAPVYVQLRAPGTRRLGCKGPATRAPPPTGSSRCPTDHVTQPVSSPGQVYNKRNVLCQRTNKAGMKAPLTTAARGSHSPKTVTGNRSRPRAPWEHTAVGHACLAGFMICHYSTRTARNRELILIVPSPSPQKYPGGSRSLREERVLWKNTNPQKQGP